MAKQPNATTRTSDDGSFGRGVEATTRGGVQVITSPDGRSTTITDRGRVTTVGTPIPDGVALGPDGRPTTDARKARRGALLPFGGPDGGYKGFGLALAMDALGALTAGLRSAGAVSGYLFIAFKPDLFLPLAEYRREVTRRIEAIKATPLQEGVAEIRIPGERAYRTRARLLREGIEIDRKIHDALGRLAEGNLEHGG